MWFRGAARNVAGTPTDIEREGRQRPRATVLAMDKSKQVCRRRLGRQSGGRQTLIGFRAKSVARSATMSAGAPV